MGHCEQCNVYSGKIVCNSTKDPVHKEKDRYDCSVVFSCCNVVLESRNREPCRGVMLVTLASLLNLIEGIVLLPLLLSVENRRREYDPYVS